MRETQSVQVSIIIVRVTEDWRQKIHSSGKKPAQSSYT